MKIALDDVDKDTLLELLKLAVKEHPEVISRLNYVNLEKQRQLIECGRRMGEESETERIKARKIRYDDSVNRNALVGLRRSCLYCALTRKEQIEMELRLYYDKYELQPPGHLLKELKGLT